LTIPPDVPPGDYVLRAYVARRDRRRVVSSPDARRSGPDQPDRRGRGRQRAPILDAARRAHERGATLAVFPELALAGYPPRDLLERSLFVTRLREALEALARDLPPLSALIGFVERNPDGAGRGLCNAAALVEGGRVAGTYRKRLLPTYDVFDEDRHFEPVARRSCSSMPAGRSA